MSKRILAADIGGTHSRFAVFKAQEPNELRMLHKESLNTPEASSLGELLDQLAAMDFPLSPRTADYTVIALAGPVRDGKIVESLANIKWSVDLTDPAQDPGTKDILLINDFMAQAYACRSGAVADAKQIMAGTKDPKGALAVVGAGTGLGKCALIPLTPEGGGYAAAPSEGGHALFPLDMETGDEDAEFAEFIRRETGRRHVVNDQVVSGSGLRLLHRRLTGEDLPPAEIAAKLAPGDETLTRFARYYGRVCRQYALEVLALGGLVVTGGVAARSPILVRDPAFGAEFRDSETHGRLLANIPVRLNRDQDAGLWGAAELGKNILKQGSRA